MPVRKQQDEVFPNSAAVDVGASEHWVCAAPRLAEQADCDPVRRCGAMTDDLHALADWLLGLGIEYVAIESTGVYWIPLYDVLESRGLKVWLTDTRQTRSVPGRKSDILDCQWNQKLMALGLLRPNWRPEQDVRVIRAVCRQRDTLIAEQASWVQRMQKELVQMNIQLAEVLSDVMGQTGEAIIRAIVAGERDPRQLARHRNRRVKASVAEVQRALTGNWREEHLFVLSQAVTMYDALGQRITECERKLQDLLGSRTSHHVDLGRPPRAGTKARKEFDLRQMLADWTGVDLTRINGIQTTTALKVLSELGPRGAQRFATVKRFCSWLGLCPGTKISGGKILSARTKFAANRIRQALKTVVMSLRHSDSALGAFYRRLCLRMDTPRANTAVAHKLARMIYFMLTRGEAYVDRGQEHYEELQRQRNIAALKRRAAALGFQVQQIPEAA
ncbi:MAG TPA: IS110 family transposase [Ramlibacter sp.]|uniref:IS110 family transposase n=1 Tax=Ramlibacter sp. TaxID=1917967 RepID=UPI002D8010B1|nr:IS110 family transposase [Ramlibacter sp.]HET8748951.1 IS110 family transposase [Ramlibacter sp.]